MPKLKGSTLYAIRQTVESLNPDRTQTQKTVDQIEVYLKKDQEHNGYTNFDTWLMSLNLDNDQYLNSEVMRTSNGQGEIYDKAEQLKDWVESKFYVEKYGIIKICDTWTERDFQSIDWCDIIRAHVDESCETEEDTEELDESTLSTIAEINGEQ